MYRQKHKHKSSVTLSKEWLNPTGAEQEKEKEEEEEQSSTPKAHSSRRERFIGSREKEASKRRVRGSRRARIW
jgi:hypothetical protein